MEVITIDSQAYKELVAKINAIAKFVIDHQDGDKMKSDEMWVDSYNVYTFLKINKRSEERALDHGPQLLDVVLEGAPPLVFDSKKFLPTW